MIVLPKGAVIVVRDKKEEIAKEGLILSMGDLKPGPPDTGTIMFTSEELNRYQGCKVRFRENFSEDIEMKGYSNLLFFRDLESSMYYIITDDKG